MATLFKNKLEPEIGTTPIEVLSTPSNARVTIIGLSLTNLTESVVLATITLEDTLTNVTAHYIKDVILPPNQSLRVINGGEKLILGPDTAISIVSNTPDSLDLVMSYVEIV